MSEDRNDNNKESDGSEEMDEETEEELDEETEEELEEETEKELEENSSENGGKEHWVERATPKQVTYGGLIFATVIIATVILASTGAVSPTASVSEFEYPNGTSPQGIDNLNETLQSHNNNLREDSYSISLVAESESQSDVSLSYTYDSDNSLVYVTQDIDGEVSESYIRFEDKQGFSYAPSASGENQSTYNRFYVSQSEENVETAAVEFAQFAQAANFEATEVVSGPNGEDAVVYSLTESDQFSEQLNVDGTVTLSENGYFTSADLTLEQLGNETMTTEQNIEITEIGSATVEDPEWLDEAEAQTEEAEEPQLQIPQQGAGG